MNVSDEMVSEYQKQQADGSLIDFYCTSNDGTKFGCHRVVFAAASRGFKRITTAEMQESKDRQVKLPICADSVQVLLDHLYGLPASIENGASFAELLEIAQMWDIPSLRRFVVQQLIEKRDRIEKTDLLTITTQYKLPILD